MLREAMHLLVQSVCLHGFLEIISSSQLSGVFLHLAPRNITNIVYKSMAEVQSILNV